MLTVRIEINRQAAVLAGKAWEGSHELQLDEADLASFTVEERELLACIPSGMPGRGPAWGSWHGQTAFFSVVEPTFTAFAGALRKHLAELQERARNIEVQAMQARADRADRDERDAQRIERAVRRIAEMTVEELDAAYQHSQGFGDIFSLPELKDPTGDVHTIPPGRVDRAVASVVEFRVKRRAASELADAQKERERRAKLRDAIRAYGTATQLARWNEGLCPESEAIDLQREAIFRQFGDVPRFRSIEEAEIFHTEGCQGPDIETVVAEAKELTDAEYIRLVALRARLPEGYTLKVREHRVWCSATDCEDSDTISRNGALVETTWNGVSFSREFALDTE